MGENSKIEWTHHTFNPWRGCTKVDALCDHCYAETGSKRNPKVLGVWGDGGTRVVASEAYWNEPLKWNLEASAAGERRRVFCASLADVFEDRAELVKPRARLFELIAATPWLDWLLLTKRPENIRKLWPLGQDARDPGGRQDAGGPGNVWLGTSVGDQASADKRVPALLKCRELAPVLFLSCEPMLGAIEFRVKSAECRVNGEGNSTLNSELLTLNSIDWVICGGESGHGARAMHPDWARGLRDQCQASGVSFFFKQWGEWIAKSQTSIEQAGKYDWGTLNANGSWFPDTTPWASDVNESIVLRVGKKAAGRVLDGRVWDEMPAAAAGLGAC